MLKKVIKIPQNKMLPKIREGASCTDSRGTLFFNNDFDATKIKRMFVIENKDNSIVRAWQGHKIEQRWVVALKGSFRIQLIAVDDWILPSKDLDKLDFIIYSDQLDVLHIPAGYVSNIQSLEEKSRLLVMADYFLGEIEDEYRYAIDYFD